MRYQKYFMPILLTPDATIAIVVPHQVDGTLPERPPERLLNCRLPSIDLDERSRRNNVCHAVVIEPNDSVGKALGLQALEKRSRSNAPFFRSALEKIGLSGINAVIKIQPERNIRFCQIERFKCRFLWRRRQQRVLGVAVVDSKHSQHLSERDLEDDCQGFDLIDS